MSEKFCIGYFGFKAKNIRAYINNNTYIHFQVSSVLQMLSVWLEWFAQAMMSLIGRMCSKFTETERKEVIQIIPARPLGVPWTRRGAALAECKINCLVDL